MITDALKISSDTLALTSYQDYKWTQPRTHCGYPTTRFTFNLSFSLIKKYIRKVFGWCFTIISSWLVKYSLATLKYQITRFASVTDNQLICIQKSCLYPAWVCIDSQTKPITVLKKRYWNSNTRLFFAISAVFSPTHKDPVNRNPNSGFGEYCFDQLNTGFFDRFSASRPSAFA